MALNSDYTNFTQSQYSPSNYREEQSYAQNLGNIQLSVNKMFGSDVNNLFNNPSLPGIGIYSSLRDPDEYGFTRFLFGASNKYFETKSATTLRNAISDPTLQAKMNNLSFSTGMKLEYQPLDNGDQLRRFGFLMVNTIRDNKFIMAIESYTLAKWKIDNSAPSAVEIPAITDYNTPQRLDISVYKAWENSNNNCICKPFTGNCANGFQKVYLIKKNTFKPGAKQQKMVGWIVDVQHNLRNDGGMSLFIKWGISRGNAYVDSGNNPQFQTGLPVTIAPGDVLLFDGVTPTTEGLPELSGFPKATPKVYNYVSVGERFLEPLFTHSKSDAFLHLSDQLPYEARHKYSLHLQMRDIFMKFANRTMYSEESYAAGQRRPIPIEGSTDVNYTDCDVIPDTMRGIFPTIENFGQNFTHLFTSSNDTAGQFKIGRIMELYELSIDGMDKSFRQGLVLTGAIRRLKQLQSMSRPLDNYLPNNYNEASMQKQMKGASFLPNAKNFIGQSHDAKPTDIDSIELGNRSYTAVNDTTLSNIYADTIWGTCMNAWTWFAPDIEGLMNKDLGFNPYLNPTGAKGLVTPTIYTQSIVPTYIGGQMQYKARQDTNVDFQVYMQVGLHPEAPYLPHMFKMQLGSKIANPAFNPANPTGPNNQPYIYGGLDLLDLGYAAAEKSVTDSVTYWNQDSIYS